MRVNKNSMYRGAMEPSLLIGVCPWGWGAGWAVARKKAPTPSVLDTRGYNTEHYPTERLLACKLSGYWTTE